MVKERILPVMLRRLQAFMLALVVTTGPAAIVACELTCVGQDESRGGPAHSCHPAKSADTASTINAVHACGHGDALPATWAKMTAQGAPAIVATAPPFLLDAAGIQRRSPPVTPSPPGPTKAALPLRI
jgi:hypothetical protein